MDTQKIRRHFVSQLGEGLTNITEERFSRIALAVSYLARRMERGGSMIENTFIIVDLSTGKAVCELSDRLAQRVGSLKFKLVRPSDYLPTLNRKETA